MGVRSPDAPPSSRSARPSQSVRGNLPTHPPRGVDTQDPTAVPVDPATPRSDRDVRSKRPPALSFVLRMDTMRRGLRALSLLALDLFGLSLAIFTALALKAAVLSSFDAQQAFEGTRSILAFAYLLTALLFARSGLYAERSQRPGLSRIVGSLFQVAFVALIFAVVSGEHFSSFYIFYGSLAFALLYVSPFATPTSEPPGRSCAPPAISAGPYWSAPASTSTTWPTPWPTAPTRRSKSSASSRPSPCLPTESAASARSTTSRP